MKKTLAMILALAMIFALCACGEAPAAVQPQTPTAAPEEDPISTQIIALFNGICMLKTNPEYEKYYYCITDLDHNGRLEVTGAITQGTDSKTTALMYEMGEDFKTLELVDMRLAAGEHLPEIIKNQVETYHVDADDSWNYIFYDTSSVGAGGHYQTVYSVCLRNRVLERTALGYQDIVMEGENTKYVFTDAAGAQLSGPDDYTALGPKHFGKASMLTGLDWFTLDEIYSTERLAKSYAVFAGTEAPSVDPVVTPLPVITPNPSAAPTASPSPTPAKDPVLTKNPTSETLYEGGSCQFVAKADNASGMKWKLVAPNGTVYDATSSPFAGQVVVSGANTTCLTLSSVPLGMNGYSAYAEFYGTKTIQSGRATMTVNKREIPTVSASVGSGYVFSNVWNTVALYSSDGGKIHYECTKSGDTGPYESRTINSGESINITGVEGQYVEVEVYANVVGSDKVAYFRYGVERSPREYTEEGYVTGDNYAEVFIQTSSGVQYIPKTSCTFNGTGVYQVGDYAVVTFRNGEHVWATIYCTWEEPQPQRDYTEEGYVTGDNYAEVFIQTSSGVHYIPKSACTFSGTGFCSVGDYAVITFRNGEPIYAAIVCRNDEPVYEPVYDGDADF